MAKTISSSEHSALSLYLPSALPEVFLQHHGKSLFPRMNEWQARNTIPPVLLLTGQPGIGKRSSAYFLSQWILCENRLQNFRPEGTPFGDLESSLGDPVATLDFCSRSQQDPLQNFRPCGDCLSCRKILSGHSVDLTEILSDADNPLDHTSGTLKTDQFRKLKTSAGFGAEEESYKIIVIPNTDRMTPQAANSVLKLLEEPPIGWIFLLTANDPTLLLATLVSRCQIIRLKPFTAEQLQELLTSSGVDSKRLKICAEIAQGSWRRALDFASDEIWEQRKLVLRFFKDPPSVLQVLMDWASQEPSHFGILLDLLEQGTADLIRRSIQTESSAARLFWMDRAEDIALARQQYLSPVNRKLLIQNLLLPWLGATPEATHGVIPGAIQ